MDDLLIPARAMRFEPDPTKGSRFLASIEPVSTAEEAAAFVARVSTEFAAASHNCFAWRLGVRGEPFRSSDDGEPSGSAGRPILAQLEGHRVTNVACVVTRWFGGTKLGVGGLVRAYGGAAGKALDRAELVPLVVMRRVVIAFPYACSGAVEGVLAAHGLAPVESDYGEDVRLALDVPERLADGLLADLVEASGGRVRTG